MSWEKVRLGDIADFSNGINFDKSAYSQGVKLIGVSNFGNRHYPDYNSLQEVKSDIVRPADYLQDGDIVLVRSNGNKELVGRCMLIQNPPEPVTFSGFCICARLRESNRYYPKFFAYHFKSSAFRRAMSGTAVGANIQNLSQARLCNYELSVPDYREQVQIASVLSIYDDLIENNQKQIKLLEEAAQRLYKEWFVDLHFPGYEKTPVADGVPEGWSKDCVQNVSCVLRRGISPKYSEFGNSMVINQKCIRQSIMDMSEARTQEKEYPAEINLQDGDTVICSTGAGTLGRVGQVFGNYPNTTFDSHVTLVRANDSISKQYLYLFLKSKQAYLMGMGKGSTNQLELNRSVIQELSVLVPTKDILERFEPLAQGIHEKISVLNQQIIDLKESRDLLLPRLMSGEIEV